VEEPRIDHSIAFDIVVGISGEGAGPIVCAVETDPNHSLAGRSRGFGPHGDRRPWALGDPHMPGLTKHQKPLVQELREIYDLLSLDFYDIKAYPKEQRTTRLELMRRAAVRQEVVTTYTHIDEYLASELCVHFFGTERKFPALWKTKKFQLFNCHFLEEMSLLPKFRYVKALRKIPKAIASDIERLNALRNGIAHAFFPNLKKSRAVWRDKSIFSLEGLKAFHADMLTVKRFFERIRRSRY
jgi:hypothetical protein